MTQRPADTMLPNPHIIEVSEPLEVHPEAEAAYLQLVNTEARLMGEGVDPRVLPLGARAVRHAESAVNSISDPMTGLLNRKGMEMWLERYRPETFAVLFADGRGFGDINNTYGHDMGDKVIRHIGKNIAGKFRTKHDEEHAEQRANPNTRDAAGIVRWGGDEFMVFIDLTNVPEEMHAEVLRMGQERLNKFDTFHDDESGIDIPIEIRSVGMIGHGSDNKNLEDYYKNLDQGLSDLKALEKEQ